MADMQGISGGEADDPVQLPAFQQDLGCSAESLDRQLIDEVEAEIVSHVVSRKTSVGAQIVVVGWKRAKIVLKVAEVDPGIVIDGAAESVGGLKLQSRTVVRPKFERGFI